MKKRIVSVALVVVMAVWLCGCGTTYQQATGKTENEASDEYLGRGYFTVITEWGDARTGYHIVYANDTKVKYLVMTTGITPLYNADGTLQVYEETADEPPEETK